MRVFILSLVLATALASPQYVYEKPSIPFPPPPKSNVEVLVEKPFQGYNYQKPVVSFTLPNEIPIAPRPTNPPPKASLPPVSSTIFVSPPVRKGYNYPKPVVPFTLPQQEIFVTTPRPIYTTPRPTNPPPKPFLPPVSSTVFVSPPVRQGYDYPKPAVPFTFPQQEIIVTTPRPIYTTPRPTNPPPKPALPPVSSTIFVSPPVRQGYDYPKPVVSFTLPQQEIIFTTPRPRPPNPPPKASLPPVSSTIFVSPPVRQGYNYPKPVVPFTLPQQEIFVTTPRPIYTTPRPTNPPPKPFLPPVSSTVFVSPPVRQGYDYPKPAVPFTFPQQEIIVTTPRPIYTTPRPTNPPPKPALPPVSSTIFVSPPVRQGYNYPKPVVPFTLPQQEIFVTTPRPVYTTPRPTNPPPKPFLPPVSSTAFVSPPVRQGYNYPTPVVSFTLPPQQIIVSTPRPRPPNPPPKASLPPISSTIIASPPRQGYSYPKPVVSFTLPQREIIISSPRPIISSPRPTNPPPKPSLPVKQGYSYSSPSIPFTLPSPPPPKPSVEFSYIPPRPTQPQPIQTVTFASPTPSYIPPSFNPVTLPPPKPVQTGYQYPKPSIPFTIPARNPPTISVFTPTPTPIHIVTASPPPSYQPSIPISIPSPSANYVTISSTPSAYEPQVFISSIRPPPPPPPKAAVEVYVPQPIKATGYSYPKPSNPLTFPPRLPSTPAPTFFVPSTTPAYIPPVFISSTPPPAPRPKPTIEIVKPLQVGGYNYPKPSNPFTLPPRHQPLTPAVYVPPVFISSTPPPPPPPKATVEFVQQSVRPGGYNYPRPQVEFTLPPPTVPAPPPPKPSIEIVNSYAPPTKFGGYHYDPPSIPFES